MRLAVSRCEVVVDRKEADERARKRPGQALGRGDGAAGGLQQVPLVALRTMRYCTVIIDMRR